jgi:hypothetical protein
VPPRSTEPILGAIDCLQYRNDTAVGAAIALPPRDGAETLMPNTVPQKSLAMVTMLYNEPDFLPRWLDYYGRQVGLENCYVIDHGSNDGSTQDLRGANHIRIPRSPMDEIKRSAFVSELVNSLLKWFDFVAYTDVDEFLVVDPARFSSLRDYCTKTDHDVTTAFGFNVIHRMHQNVPITAGQTILSQRRWLFPNSSMAKPLLTRIPLQWPGGFHSWNGPAVFDGLFNFHLAYFDFDITMRRQAKRRSVEWAAHFTPGHHVADDAAIQQQMEHNSAKPEVLDISLDENCQHMQRFIRRIILSQNGRDNNPYKIDMNIWGNSIWYLPDRFCNSL